MNSPLDQYFEDFGTQLEQAADAALGRERRRAVWSATVVTASVVIAVAVLLISGGSTTKPVDAIAAARLAVTPSKGEVIYLRVATRSIGREQRGSGPRTITRQWMAGEPTRWRFAQNYDTRVGIPASGTKQVRGRREIDYASGRQAVYDSAPPHMTITTGLDETDARLRAPNPFFAGDPQRTLPGLLQQGRLQDRGIVRSDGRTVRRLQRVEGTGRLRREFIYDVDPKTFAPVGGEERWYGTVSPGQAPETTPTVVLRYVVDTYRRLPLNTTTARLVAIHPPPGTKVIRYAVKPPSHRRTRTATCIARPDGSLACRPSRP